MTAVPKALAEIVEDFEAVGGPDKLQLLLELSEDLPLLPPEYADHPELLEQVHECQSPLFLAVEVDGEGRVRLIFDAPPEAPTTRGFAAMLYTGLNGLPADQVLAVPNDFYVATGLAEVVSPLRVRGLTAMLARIKRQVREQVAA